MEGNGNGLDRLIHIQFRVHSDGALNLIVISKQSVGNLPDNGGVQGVGGHQNRADTQRDHILVLPVVGARRDAAHRVAVVKTHQLINGPLVRGNQADIHFLRQLGHRVGGRARRAEKGVQLAPLHGGGGFSKGQPADLQLIQGQSVGP